MGGEGAALFEALSGGARLRACCALFPEVVGGLAIDVLANALAGGSLPAVVQTPYVLLVPETLEAFYRREGEGWSLKPEAAARLRDGVAAGPAARSSAARRSIGFLPHYPAHDWYRNMIRAMQRRADELGLELRVGAPQEGIARELEGLRRLIARTAARLVRPGSTILVNPGSVSLMLAEELRAVPDVTVVTNSLEVMERLSGQPGQKLILTSGEYQARGRCLVGPSLGALFETLRGDQVFLAVDGISARFGPSAADERLALAARRFVGAVRRVVVLADHSVVGHEANHRIVPLDAVDEIVTDSGSLPADRLAFASAGVRMVLADEETEASEAPLDSRPQRRASLETGRP
jgi:DeoR/GlpR family transcriptional regulator of sugar metabolism